MQAFIESALHKQQQKGLRTIALVERQAIDAALDGVDEVTTATKAAEPKARRWQGLPEEEFFKKVGSFLQRRGFSYDIVKEATAALWEEVNGQDEEANNQV